MAARAAVSSNCLMPSAIPPVRAIDGGTGCYAGHRPDVDVAPPVPTQRDAGPRSSPTDADPTPISLIRCCRSRSCPSLMPGRWRRSTHRMTEQRHAVHSCSTFLSAADVHLMALPPPRLLPPRGGSGGGSDAETGVRAVPPPLLPLALEARVDDGSDCRRPDRRRSAPGRRRLSAPDADRACPDAAPERLAACSGRAAGAGALAVGRHAGRGDGRSAAAWLKRVGGQRGKPRQGR